MLEVTLILCLSFALAYPLGYYLAGIFSGQAHFSDRVF